jgi:hypothetical protein
VAADLAPFQFFLAALAGWLSRHLQDVIAYLWKRIESCGPSCAADGCASRMINGVAWRRVDTVSGVPR